MEIRFVGGPLDGQIRDIPPEMNSRLHHDEALTCARHIYCYVPARYEYHYTGMEPMPLDT